MFLNSAIDLLKEFINVACLSQANCISYSFVAKSGESTSFLTSLLTSSSFSTNIICCARIIDANCILIFIQRISIGSMFSTSFIISIVSLGKYLENNPCFLALAFFFIFSGGAPVDLPPCILQRPFAIAFPLHGFPDLVFAPQCFQLFAWGLFCIYNYTTIPLYNIYSA